MNKWVYYLIGLMVVVVLFYCLWEIIDLLEPPALVFALITLLIWTVIALIFIIFFGLFLFLKYKKRTIAPHAIWLFRKKFWGTALPVTFLIMLYNRITFYYNWDDLAWPAPLEMMAILMFFVIAYLYINALIAFIYVEEEWKYRWYFRDLLLFLLILPIGLGAIAQWYL